MYFLPSAQSVPTVSRRLPVRLRPVPTRMSRRRLAHVDQAVRPRRSAAAFSSGEPASARACLKRCRDRPPVPRRGLGIQLGFRTPPVFATPITSERRTSRLRLARPSCGSPARDRAPSAARTRRCRGRSAQSRRPNAVLAYPASVVSPRNRRYGAAQGDHERSPIRRQGRWKCGLPTRRLPCSVGPSEPRADLRSRSCAAGSWRILRLHPGTGPAG